MIDIKDKHDCCGCTACESICGVRAIFMQLDNEGFSYPFVDTDKCTDCGMCERVCPIIRRDKCSSTDTPIKIYGLHNKNKSIWESSSSGGVFSALAEVCLKEEGVVYGAEYDDDFVVVHRGESTTDGVVRFRGSKYVQSDLTGVFKEIRQLLRDNRRVLFSGVPCQVEGLKNFLIRPYENLTTVDILCHGVPSPKIFADYISFIRRYSIFPLQCINMKDKTFGWGYQNLRLYFSKGGSIFNIPISNLWNRLFYDHVINRPSCHKCRFKNIHRAGDFSIGDFWGIDKSHPDFFSDKGVSLLLVNSKSGMEIWDRIKEEFIFFESNINECMQPVLSKSYPEPSDRITFWKSYFEKGFANTIKERYNLSWLQLQLTKISQFKNFIKNI